MKPQPAQTVYTEIVAHMNRYDANYPSWRCGIASAREAERRKDSGAAKAGDAFIVRRCRSNADARAVAQSLLRLGCRAAGGAEGDTDIYVFAYPESSETGP